VSFVQGLPVRLALPAVAALLLAVACSGSIKAPEIQGISRWINSEPLTMEELRGRVVLVDFWTYTCVNCIRTFPYLKSWHDRYQDDGLVIVGVHAPEFEFEKDYDNVLEATQANGIAWPVALDNDFETWRNYSNRYWPAKYLIDQHGTVRYNHFGEGAYDTTERMIRRLLEETGADLSDDERASPAPQAIDPLFLEVRNGEVTRELYAGSVRGPASGSVQQPEYLQDVGNVVHFDAPEELRAGAIYFDGAWRIGLEEARHGRETTGYEDSLSPVYSARSVNAVLTSETGEPYKVLITLDAENLTEQNKGADVIIDSNGESYLWVDEPRLYAVIETPNYVRRSTLKMASNSEDFGLFAFTFGIYEDGP